MEHVFLDEMAPLQLSEQTRTEYCVAEYFRRRGWQVERIDEDSQQRPDWFICFGDTQLLCEVKTISSARRGDHPEDIFDTNFRNPVLAYFQRTRFRNLFYNIVIDNDTMTAPSKEETLQFAKWLGEAILEIHQGGLPAGWERINYHLSGYYRGEYTFASGRPKGTSNRISIRLSPAIVSQLHITIPAYGGINSGPLQDRVGKAVKQLDYEAHDRNNLAIPRIVAISLRDGIGLDWSTTMSPLTTLLRRYARLSAIAILDWIPETDPFVRLNTRWFLAFVVLHNQQSRGINPLPALVFEDGHSKQHYGLTELLAKAKTAGL